MSARTHAGPGAPKTCPHGLGFNCRRCWPAPRLSRLVPLCAALALAACVSATFPEQDRDEDVRRTEREHMAEWCRMVGPCVQTAAGRLMPAPGAPALPTYSDACGYLPPVYGDDC